MAFKFVILLAVMSVASAGVIEAGWQPQAGWQAPTHGWQQPTTVIKQVQPATIIKSVQPTIVKQVVHEAPANYEFNYEVHDTHTGDIKRQHEKAENGHISGQYSLVDPDGYRRVVTYTADDHHGFQANVQREPVDHKLVAHAPVVTKVIQPATIQKVIQPATIQKVITAPVVSHGWQAPAHGWN
ncbi:hypothetical protein PVAND_006483 [Polypedilum vanderplanki]|uniref:Cuticle protein n=1 Tax=Polypedilum vanderplanki TaxID=319348 RepID=A0A9J6C3C1_POLVA|nr:hypothetical protein PVAND_006483 [Polypedilum vanderplanki]